MGGCKGGDVYFWGDVWGDVKGGMYGVKGDVNFTTPLMESRGVAKIFTTVVSAAGDFFLLFCAAFQIFRVML